MHPLNPKAKIALFDVGPALENIIAKYGIASPMSTHDFMVINLWFAAMFDRVHIVKANPHPSVYDFSPLTPADLTLINDVSLDTFFTRTVKWQMLKQCVEFLGPVITVRLSASTLVVEF
jgi:hypothetical protein